MRLRIFRWVVAVLFAVRPAQGWDWGLVPLLGPRHSLLDRMNFSILERWNSKMVTDNSEGNFQGFIDDEVAKLLSGLERNGATTCPKVD